MSCTEIPREEIHWEAWELVEFSRKYLGCLYVVYWLLGRHILWKRTKEDPVSYLTCSCLRRIRKLLFRWKLALKIKRQMKVSFPACWALRKPWQTLEVLSEFGIRARRRNFQKTKCIESYSVFHRYRVASQKCAVPSVLAEGAAKGPVLYRLLFKIKRCLFELYKASTGRFTNYLEQSVGNTVRWIKIIILMK